ncbi:phosphohydrolase [Vulcanibacillus modesticaldus]|uniref:bis(5'-nucleosyl)-tetraphosphatase (symmetrical) n=1 Tax=Vulcanibacillus modesticaldus TaxID=337097 RepID=A0A1D2YTI5_9BACI|nr:bis(5'-nucleosyl)-tetraphosphatase (symmetrical) YqeK [Vulcanibacillus modesticaldus]OEF99008.1 phosphohydrolase [Vulcanibacillus modesticaldus]
MENKIALLKSALEKQVTEKRFLHSLGVAETAKELAVRNGADVKKAEIAGLLHDFAKNWPKEKMIEIIVKYQELPNDLLEYNEELWHGPVASIIVREKLEITDNDIIMAIRYHTSGREKMSLLEKIVCLADYIEPLRQYPGVDEIRKLAKLDLNQALLTALDRTITFLIQKKSKIYPLTFEARNSLIDEIGKLTEGGS